MYPCRGQGGTLAGLGRHQYAAGLDRPFFDSSVNEDQLPRERQGYVKLRMKASSQPSPHEPNPRVEAAQKLECARIFGVLLLRRPALIRKSGQ